ncbi:DNA-binding IclR family transcriptional regulator [Variovorax boronicumulans]|uniref:DNA-binding IclR family transcriptional regulator n=1 Tax=Variovorax boronicumulans TaxID=436515 RepID=A0AAW8D7V7_9BURK|nr:IclR family transcriptional regulator [Variovorax boronicumulans]MDP9896609.1 DNA-binding IclR family transcriptional regulator [Variovorax boronicumulans]MDQ0044044.1 DNA-binding IclR family transcriptional regulator [Variovorax boronicumulans]MDQ0056608.1 DNA-binding IclR family transcriptional regulator [Variovorax boronicumulans]
MPRKAQTESVSDLNAAPGGAAAVDRALSLLSAFRPGDEALSLAQFAERTQLYKSTALRLLASLEHARLIRRQDDGRYTLGMEIARLHGLYAASQSLDRIVLPVLRALAAATGESAAYHVRQDQGDGWVRLCQFRVDSSHVVRDHVRAGDLLPNDRGAGARVLIAFGPDTDRPRGARERKLYEAIRAQGFCALVGDRTAELAGISAPVLHADGSLAAAVTLTMPTHRYDEGYIEPVRAAAKELSGQV